MSEELKIWRCPNGHALGVVKRNGKGLHQLLLYRHAVQMDGNPAQVDVMAVVEGSVMDIRCEICGEMRTWVIGQEAMDKLLATWRKMHGNEVPARESNEVPAPSLHEVAGSARRKSNGAPTR